MNRSRRGGGRGPGRQPPPVVSRCSVVLQKLSDETVKEINNPKYCNLCHRSPSDPLLYGKMYTLGSITVHHYCLLFASMLLQKGDDDEGIKGFLEEHIMQTVAQSRREMCSYCGDGGATIICVQRMCKKVFHLPCGLENGSQHHYFGTFQSFCKMHRPNHKLTIKVMHDPDPTECAICMDEVEKDSKCINTVWAPCCKKNSWLHRICIQKYALSAGYFFKCPKCNNKNVFKKAMLHYGIFVPEQDASWELEGHQFDDLYLRHDQCDADVCICPDGRDIDDDDTEWEVILCSACGSQGIHIGCSPFKTAFRKWFCQGCKPLFMQSAPVDASSSALISRLIMDSDCAGPSTEVVDQPTPVVTENCPETEPAAVERYFSSQDQTLPLQPLTSATQLPDALSGDKPTRLFPIFLGRQSSEPGGRRGRGNRGIGRGGIGRRSVRRDSRSRQPRNSRGSQPSSSAGGISVDRPFIR